MISSLTQAPRDPARWFLTEEGKPQERLISLLEIDKLYNPNDSLEQLVKKTQEAWVKVRQGQNNKERADLVDTQEQQSLREKVARITQEIGLFGARLPEHSHYKYGAWLGATLDGVRLRLRCLIEAWNRGVRFDTFIVFTGYRPLRADEPLEKLLISPLKMKPGWQMAQDAPYKTEYDMMKLVLEQTELPEDMAKALEGKIVFVNAPKPDGEARASTKDCYLEWLKTNPEKGSMLAYSHPLIWPYQQLAGENVLGSEFQLDTCAEEVSQEILNANQARLVSLVQDVAAKCLYELHSRQKVCQ